MCAGGCTLKRAPLRRSSHTQVITAFSWSKCFCCTSPPRRRLSCFQACSEEPWVGSNKSCLAVAVAELASHFSPAEKKREGRRLQPAREHRTAALVLQQAREGCEGHTKLERTVVGQKRQRRSLKKNCPLSENPQLAKQALDNRVPALQIYLGIGCLFFILRWSNVAEAMKGGCISARRKIFNLHQ